MSSDCSLFNRLFNEVKPSPDKCNDGFEMSYSFLLHIHSENCPLTIKNKLIKALLNSDRFDDCQSLNGNSGNFDFNILEDEIKMICVTKGYASLMYQIYFTYVISGKPNTMIDSQFHQINPDQIGKSHILQLSFGKVKAKRNNLSSSKVQTVGGFLIYGDSDENEAIYNQICNNTGQAIIGFGFYNQNYD